jgi:hypothetical protein
MLLEQLAGFAVRLLGVLQAFLYYAPTLDSNLQSARYDPAEKREDDEEEHQTQNHLGETWPDQELVDGRYERIGGNEKNRATYRHKPLRPCRQAAIPYDSTVFHRGPSIAWELSV